MKQRYSARVSGGNYEVLDPSGVAVKAIPLAEARNDSKLASAIARNGWPQVPEA